MRHPMMKSLLRTGKGAGGHVCPPAALWTFDNFFRPLVHDPVKLFSPYVEPGMTVLDVGCGGGWASLALARLVGESGRVVSADLQPEMLEKVRNRARKAGLAGRVRLHLCRSGKIGLDTDADFAVAFWMMHEVPDRAAFAGEIFRVLRPGGRFFLAEPKMHVSGSSFRDMVRRAGEAGFRAGTTPRVRLSRAALFEKPR